MLLIVTTDGEAAVQGILGMPFDIPIASVTRPLQKFSIQQMDPAAFHVMQSLRYPGTIWCRQFAKIGLRQHFRHDFFILPLLAG